MGIIFCVNIILSDSQMSFENKDILSQMPGFEQERISSLTHKDIHNLKKGN